MKSLRVLASLLMLTVCRLADAGIITIDPSYYAAGTDLSHVAPGVTLSTWTWVRPLDLSGPTYSPVYATDCPLDACHSLGGQRVFGNGHYDGIPVFGDAAVAKNYIVWNDPTLHRPFSVFRADFDSPTNFVQLLMGGSGGGDPPMVAAFDREGHLVGECKVNSTDTPCATNVTGQSPITGAWYLTLNTGMDNIAYILAGGVNAGSRVGSLTYVQKSVPEPAQFGLLVSGLVGMWAARRKKGRATR